MEVGRGGQGVDTGVHHELQRAGLQLEHVGLPEDVLLLLGGEGEEVALHLQPLGVLLQLVLAGLPGGPPSCQLFHTFVSVKIKFNFLISKSKFHLIPS